MNRKFFWTIIILYCVITFVQTMHHQPFFDESRAWLLAENLNLFEVFKTMRTEGHTFIWYALLMPFAKTHIGFPYVMYFLNWIFCVIAIIIMWIYAPFNTVLKVLITFSLPFFSVYPVLARCYSLGILLLFILTVMFKEKLKYPYLYSTLIFLCANTSIMSMIGAFTFAIFLFYELFKFKQFKELFYCSLLAIFCISIIVLQFYNAETTILLDRLLIGLNLNFFAKVFIFSPIINFLLLSIIVPLILYLFSKDKQSLAFLMISYGLLLSVFHFVYLGYNWHRFFFFVYLLIAAWIFFQSKNPTFIFKKYLTMLLIFISFLYCIDFRIEKGFYSSGSRNLANTILERDKSGIIFYGNNFIPILPYLDNRNVDYYYSNLSEKVDNHFKIEHEIKREINFDIVYKISQLHENTYFYVSEPDTNKIWKNFVLNEDNKTLIFKLRERFGPYVYVYFIEKIK